MGRLGRILLVALAVLATALALAACGGGSSTSPSSTVVTEDVGPGETAGPLPAFDSALEEAAASKVPVRIPPSLLESPPGGAEEATVLRSPADSYTLGISTDPGCHLQGDCTAAIFSGFAGVGELVGQEVKLAQGIDGVYEPGRCGPGCQFGTIEWIQEHHRYGVAVAKVPLAKLTGYANEAIEAQPLGG